MAIVRVVLGLALLLVTTDALAQSATATCKRGCKDAKRACLASSRDIFRTAKADCAGVADRTAKKSCRSAAKTSFRDWKGACATTFASCRSCCQTNPSAAGGTCSGTPGVPATETSQICPGARGGLAVYWDWLNGVFHPLAQVPTPDGVWPSFFHSGYPLLSFQYPPGWTPTQIAAEQTVGVNLFRNDGAAAWRWLGTWGDTSRGPRAWRDFELSSVLEYLGNPTGVRTICVNEGSQSPAPGLLTAASNIVVEAGDFTIFVVSINTSLDGLAGGQVFFNTVLVPTSQRDELVFSTFLPIHFQLFIGDTVEDRDLDGVPDGQDAAPDDPTRS